MLKLFSGVDVEVFSPPGWWCWAAGFSPRTASSLAKTPPDDNTDHKQKRTQAASQDPQHRTLSYEWSGLQYWRKTFETPRTDLGNETVWIQVRKFIAGALLQKQTGWNKECQGAGKKTTSRHTSTSTVSRPIHIAITDLQLRYVPVHLFVFGGATEPNLSLTQCFLGLVFSV